MSMLVHHRRSCSLRASGGELQELILVAGRNGTARADDDQDTSVGPLDLEAIAYERVPVRVTILGERYVFQAWVKGPGCPARISSQFARLRRTMTESFGANGGAYEEFLSDALRSVFEAPANQYDAIDLLAGDSDRAQEGTADPEATSEAGQTTAPSSPTSSAAMEASAPTAAAGSTSPRA
jgi:hypothetical protein